MLTIEMKGLRWEKELQIIQADVRVAAEGRTWVEESLCIDVGMPAWAASLNGDVEPDRLSPPENWRSKPFLVCGCGDPECRAHSFAVRHHHEAGTVWVGLVEERGGGAYRVLEELELSRSEYGQAVGRVAEAFLRFAEGLEGYRPLYPDTLAVVRRELTRWHGEG